jgi:cell division protein FtsB
MKRFMKLRHDILSALPVLISAFVIAWCGFYLLFGANSIFSLRALKVQEAQLSSHLETVHTQRADIEDRVVRLRPDSLDWDLVEEEAQSLLGPQGDHTKSLNM